MDPILKKSTIPLNIIHKSILPQISLWIIKNPKITSNWITSIKQQNILQQHPDYLCIYRDGYKDNNIIACAAVLKKIIKTKALPMQSSIFTAEACAIDLALDIMSKEEHKKFIIFSDSLSVLISLNNNKKTRAPIYYQTTLHTTLNVKQRNRFLLDSKPYWGERKS